MLVTEQFSVDQMATLKLYNTKTRSKERFAPINSRNVGMYVCGPTVYDRAHIGNARPVVVFDVLFRLLKFLFGEKAVTYVRNITDVDDKIISRAIQENRSVEEITAETIEWFQSDTRYLKTLPPTHEPRATDFISEMTNMIKELINLEHAYVAKDGQVFFSVNSFPDYGTLSNQSTKDMIAGSRVDVDQQKRDPLDFVLWKPVKISSTGWESPWGFGRPGWHIECSAMARAMLGERFDIHGGGIDLVFPHHENEIAQSICANNTAGFANFWLHNGFVNIEGEKMSKSLGNFLTVDDLKKQGLNGDVVRFILMNTHYRQPLDWTTRKIMEASKIIERWQKLAKKTMFKSKSSIPSDGVMKALLDDLNTPLAIAELHQLIKNQEYERFLSSAQFLGLLLPTQINEQRTTNDEFGHDYVKLINDLIKDREIARNQKDYEKSDTIRLKLEGAGVIIKDTAAGTTWDLRPFFNPDFLQEKI